MHINLFHSVSKPISVHNNGNTYMTFVPGCWVDKYARWKTVARCVFKDPQIHFLVCILNTKPRNVKKKTNLCQMCFLMSRLLDIMMFFCDTKKAIKIHRICFACIVMNYWNQLATTWLALRYFGKCPRPSSLNNNNCYAYLEFYRAMRSS